LADDDSVRIELALDGGQIIGANVSPEAADAIERALAASAQGTHQLDTDDGRLSIVLSRVLYVKRYRRDSKVGFNF
jgi:hypothetical protein